MAISVFDLFSIGIGPSSSHTVGPMRAAKTFVDGLVEDGVLETVARVQAELFGSLGATGFGHGSDKAVLLGLSGERPEEIDTDTVPAKVAAIRESGRLAVGGTHSVAFAEDTDLTMHRRKSLPAHPNGMVFRAFASDGALVRERTYYSVGGGFVRDESYETDTVFVEDSTPVPYPFRTGADLLKHCADTGLPVSEIMLRNELSWRSREEIRDGLLQIWQVMAECVRNGYTHEGVLPGGLKVPRRAKSLHDKLLAEDGADDPLYAMDWVSLYALAVNEENAAGGRVVTAPTNGAAGIIPAVLHYYQRFVRGASDDGIVTFLLTAGAIGSILKQTGSISGAEVGCQGEVGSASAMAAAGLTEVLGGSCGSGRERGRDRRGAPPRLDVRPGGRAGADPVHRAQRRRRVQGDPRRAHGDARRRKPRGDAGQGDQDDARNRRGHVGEVQGDRARRTRGERHRVLIFGP